MLSQFEVVVYVPFVAKVHRRSEPCLIQVQKLLHNTLSLEAHPVGEEALHGVSAACSEAKSHSSSVPDSSRQAQEVLHGGQQLHQGCQLSGSRP